LCPFWASPVFYPEGTGHNTFIDGIRCWEVKFPITDGDMILDKALSKTVRLEAAKETAVPPVR
jgi:hypothetical protein